MKNYSKTKSMIIFIIFGLVFAIGTVLTFVPMQFGSKDYESFLGATALSTDCGNTISAIYKYTEDENSDVNKAIDMMGKSLERKYGKNSVNVCKLGDDRIRVDVAEPLLISEAEEVEEYLSGFASGKLEITNNKSYSATLETDPNLLVIDGWKDIKSVEAKNYKGSYGIEMTFTKSGKTTYGMMSGQTVYIYVNGTGFPNSSYNSVTLSEDTTTFTIWFDSDDYIEYYLNTFEAGMIPLELDSETIEIISTEANPVSLTYISIAISAMILVLYVLAIVKFRVPGVLYVIISNIGSYLMLFLLQAMPWVEVGIVSIIVLGLTKIIEFMLMYVLQKRIKEEYMLGKSLETAYEDAYKRTTPAILDTLAICLIVGLSFAIAGRLELVTIGTIIALSSVIYGVVVLVLEKLLVNCYYAFNQSKVGCYALPARTEGETNE